MVAFEVSIAILNHVTDSRVVLLNNCGHWPPFEKPEEYTAHVLAFLKGYRAASASTNFPLTLPSPPMGEMDVKRPSEGEGEFLSF
jgi:2-hydroxy-6-oxonona-2,4-dienedioate hydrolase